MTTTTLILLLIIGIAITAIFMALNWLADERRHRRARREVDAFITKRGGE